MEEARIKIVEKNKEGQDILQTIKLLVINGNGLDEDVLKEQILKILKRSTNK